MPPDFDQEDSFAARGIWPIAGIDEAGRGSLAGPVVAAALVFTNQRSIPLGVKDSKRLTAAKREELWSLLTQNPDIICAVGESSVREIEQLNILRATHLAMQRAVTALSIKPAHLLIDGLPVQGLGIRHTALVKGDDRCLSIAAASILAKVHRDRILIALDQQYPGYGFAQHKGYATREHLANISKYGITPHHRCTYAPVAQMELRLHQADARPTT